MAAIDRAAYDARIAKLRLLGTPLGLEWVEVSAGGATVVLHVSAPIPAFAAAAPDPALKLVQVDPLKDVDVLGWSSDGTDLTLVLAAPLGPGWHELSIGRAALQLDLGGTLVEIDPICRELCFVSRADCVVERDCLAAAPERELEPPKVAIDYRARDFSGLRRAMLGRIAQLTAEAVQPSAVDVTTTLVEMLAHVGDYLSYRQDHVATESHFSTARSRISLRRHARLVDYSPFEGQNARTFVCFNVEHSVAIPSGTMLRASPAGSASDAGEPFATMHALDARPEWCNLSVHAWGADDLCLSRGAVEATLRPHEGARFVGSPTPPAAPTWLALEEIEHGDAPSAQPRVGKRWVVRVVEWEATTPPATDPVTVVNGQAVEVVRVRWAVEDALPFSMCVANHDSPKRWLRATANVVLVDHGEWVEELGLGPVPEDGRFWPRVARRDVVFGAAAGDLGVAATRAVSSAVRPARAQLTLRTSDAPGEIWTAAASLFAAGPTDRAVVVEVEENGEARLRFGDDTHARRAPVGATVDVRYRVGDPRRGNVGPDAIRNFVGLSGLVRDVWNPIAATSGTAREEMEKIRQRAPRSFRRAERAVLPEDYARWTERLLPAEVQRASAWLRWVGPLQTIVIAVDRIGGARVDTTFADLVVRALEPYRTTGHTVVVRTPRFVPIHLALHVCLTATTRREQARGRILELLGLVHDCGDRAPGLLHPDTLTFGVAVDTVPILAAIQREPGVRSVRVTELARRDVPLGDATSVGRIDIGPLEIATLADDPRRPHAGTLHLEMTGGA